MSTEHELTFGEQAVGLTFNPSNKDEVYNVKRTLADLIDKVEQLPMETYLGNTIKGMAVRALITASSTVVKVLTFNE